MSILDTVKTLLNIKDDSQDAILTLYISIITQNILNYTSRTMLPVELEYEAAMMVIDMHREMSDISGTTGKATAVSEAGRSVSFDTSEMQLFAQNKLEERRIQLNKFKLPFKLQERE